MKVCFVMTNRIHSPRKTLATHATTRGFFPLCFRWETIAIGSPIHCWRCGSCFHHRSTHRVAGSKTFFLTSSIAPLHDIPPTYGLNGVIRCFPCSSSQIRITVVHGPRSHLIPLRLGHLILAHVKLAYGHIHRWSIGIRIAARASHRKGPGWNQRKPRNLQIISYQSETHLVAEIAIPISSCVPNNRLTRSDCDTIANSSRS